MPPVIQEALEVLAAVMIYATAWFIGFTSIMGVPAVWRKMKKMSDKEKKEHEEIIVKRADRIKELDEERTAVSDEVIKLKEEVQELKDQKALLKGEIKAEKKETDKPDDEPSGAGKDAQKGKQTGQAARKPKKSETKPSAA